MFDHVLGRGKKGRGEGRVGNDRGGWGMRAEGRVGNERAEGRVGNERAEGRVGNERAEGRVGNERAEGRVGNERAEGRGVEDGERESSKISQGLITPKATSHLGRVCIL